MPRCTGITQTPDMTSLQTRYLNGLSFDEMVASATENVELYRGIRARASVSSEFADRIAATGRQWYLLVLSEDWCGDAVNIVPWIDALTVSAPSLGMRILARDQNLDLMDQHLTNGRTRSIPIALLLDDSYVERAWWGPRQRPLQEWFETDAAKALTKNERYKELRRWYARDRGRTLLEELTSMIERVAAQDAAAPAMASAAS